MRKKYKGIDLFCGIGGFRLAMNSSQVECVFSSDNDKFAQQTYEANFHEVPTGDIKAVNEKDIPSFDILTAGFPCIIRKSKFPPNPERSVQFSGKRTKRSVQKKGCTQHL